MHYDVGTYYIDTVLRNFLVFLFSPTRNHIVTCLILKYPTNYAHN